MRKEKSIHGRGNNSITFFVIDYNRIREVVDLVFFGNRITKPVSSFIAGRFLGKTGQALREKRGACSQRRL